GCPAAKTRSYCLQIKAVIWGVYGWLLRGIPVLVSLSIFVSISSGHENLKTTSILDILGIRPPEGRVFSCRMMSRSKRLRHYCSEHPSPLPIRSVGRVGPGMPAMSKPSSTGAKLLDTLGTSSIDPRPPLTQIKARSQSAFWNLRALLDENIVELSRMDSARH